MAAAAGLILVDTKYEFGLAADGELLLIDEVHTPDSSRYWVAATYDERLAAGEEPESLDKEVVRRAFADAGYRGDGEPPAVPDDVWTATSTRYIDAYQRLTGLPFEPGATRPTRGSRPASRRCERIPHEARPRQISDAPREECGVLGISTPHGEGVAQLAFFGLFALQHRGQEAAGIAVSDGHAPGCTSSRASCRTSSRTTR